MKALKEYSFALLFIRWLLLGVTFFHGSSSANTISGLAAFYRDGQVFLTWTNVAGEANYYQVYRSLSPIEYGWQLAGCEYLGRTHQLSARDISLTSHYNQDYYLRIDSAGSPLPATSGLFVATTLAEGNYFYAVTVYGGNYEDTTIIPGSNTNIQSIAEWVRKPRPVFQQEVIINGKSIEVYTNYFSFKMNSYQPPINEAGWMASDFLVNRNMNTGNQPLLVRWHGGGTDFFAQIASTVSNAINLHIENILPSGNSGEYWGSNSGYNLFYKNDEIPTSGVNHNYFQQLYKHTLDWAIEYLPIDSNRIYFDGSSSGACGAFAYIQMYPEKIAAVKLSVPCFNVGFEFDADSMCSLNTGGKNRNSINLLLGKVSTNLPNSSGYPTYNMLNGAWMAHNFSNRSYPFVYAINGKEDFVVGWTEKTIYYDSVNANATGGYYFWDSRSHGGALGYWNDTNFDLFRFRRNVSYPAFSNCSLNENYGNGDKSSAAAYGTVNGALDWSDAIEDTEAAWTARCFIRNLNTVNNQVEVYPDSATADITPKRLQQFNPPVASVINWRILHRQDTIQSGSQVYTGGLITLRNIKIYRDTVQVILNYVQADTFYADMDLDGFGNPEMLVIAASVPPQYTADHSDCDDTNPLIHPGAQETCNNSDDDCDGQQDEAVQSVFYADTDNDGYGTKNQFVFACFAPGGFVGDTTDCDDSNMNIHPAADEVCNYMDDNCEGNIDETVQSAFYADADADGFGDVNTFILACNALPGYVADNTDCNDVDFFTHPFQSETCNGADDNCDSQVDENAQAIFFADADGDGFGNADFAVMSCPAPEGYVSNAVDCNDADAAISPLAVEFCNEKDDNCDGQVDEGVQSVFYADMDGDGFGNIHSAISSCQTPGGYVSDTADCDDSNIAVSPSGMESCNETDDNCDGLTDEGVQTVFFADMDEDGFGNVHSFISSCHMPIGYVLDTTDCNDGAFAISPSADEDCNAADDNCNGLVDEGAQSVFYSDADGDGFGDVSSAVLACFAENGYVSDTTDCNDGDMSIHPFSMEACNGNDDNCNGLVDEGAETVFYADSDGDGFGVDSSAVLFCIAPPGYVNVAGDCNDGDSMVSPSGMETCNSNDDNCNGQIDENTVNATIIPSDTFSMCKGSSILLQANTGPGYTFQWIKNGNLIDGATASTLEVSDAADYTVLVTVGSCSAYSPATTVVSNALPAATVTPSEKIKICPGIAVTFQANTGASLTHQWLLNGQQIPGATASQFTTASPGNYSVFIMKSNGCSKLSEATKFSNYNLPSTKITMVGQLNICATGSVLFNAKVVNGNLYQWYKNNVPIAGATGYSYTATSAGSYHYSVTTPEGCTGLSVSKNVKACKSGKTGSISAPVITVFPNPANEYFMVNIEMDERINSLAMLSISNASGAIVYRENAMIEQGKLQKTININSDFAAGIYLLRVITAGQVVHATVSITR